MASDRLKWIRGEQERRRTERGRQRSEMMEQRKQGAQTQYLQRQANKANFKGQPDWIKEGQTVADRRDAVRRMPSQATNAIAMGETQRQYVTEKDRLDTAKAAREAALITAKSPEAVQGIRTGGEERIAAGVQAGLNARQAADLALQREQYVRPGVYTAGDKTYTVGGAQIYDAPPSGPTQYVPGRIEGTDAFRTASGDVVFPPAPPKPVRVGGSLVDPTTGEERFREPTEMEEFDRTTRGQFQGTPQFNRLKESGASNEEIEAEFREWQKDEYPSD